MLEQPAFASALAAGRAEGAWINGARWDLAMLIGSVAIVPLFLLLIWAGAGAELAFQAVNVWHSFQYLALVWFIQKVRAERGLIASPFVASLSGSGAATWRYYGFCAGVSALLLAGLFGLIRLDPWGLRFEQYYFMGLLSVLLVHYALDGYLFFASHRPGTRVEDVPYAAPARPAEPGR